MDHDYGSSFYHSLLINRHTVNIIRQLTQTASNIASLCCPWFVSPQTTPRQKCITTQSRITSLNWKKSNALTSHSSLCASSIPLILCVLCDKCINPPHYYFKNL
jgi:hypothetical protein